jgi:hypothetical protein
MLKISLNYDLFCSFFLGFEEQLETATNCGELVIWKGGVARNVGLMLHGKPYHALQKDLDINTNNSKLLSWEQDVKRLSYTGPIDWYSQLEDDLSINNCMVVQLGKKLLWVGGNQYSATHIAPLHEYEDSWYYYTKKEWRKLIFAWRYPHATYQDNGELKLELIKWMEVAGIQKIPALERTKFKTWVNEQVGQEIFPARETLLQTKEEKEANYWFPDEGY